MTNANVGRFSLPRRLIDEEPAAVRELLCSMIVVRAEYLFAANVIDYTAISDRFPEVPQECAPAYYRLRQIRLADGMHLAFDGTEDDERRTNDPDL
jgi:hypothetical protein